MPAKYAVMLTAVGFDFDHTLGVDNQLERVAFVEVAHTLGAHARALVDDDAAYAIIDREIGNFRAGRCSLDQALVSAFGQVLGERAPRDAEQLFRERALSLVPQYVKPLPGVAACLAGLNAAHVPYAILTNGWNPLQQCKADSIGFDRPVLVSEELGVRKPQPEAFDALAQRLEQEPRRIAYVGDDPRIDIAGAILAGMQAIWFQWEAHAYPDDLPAPTFTVHRIEDVLNYLA